MQEQKRAKKKKIFISGNNASGKSTLVKAILQNNSIIRSGQWLCPDITTIGYIDQHYNNLDRNESAVELIKIVRDKWFDAEIRDHLNRFLFRKNEEVNLLVKYLSGGEMARLSLAIIAANPPKLLILDEITNNIDLETKMHLIQILQKYPGAMILICHDVDFVEKLEIDRKYIIANKILSEIIR